MNGVTTAKRVARPVCRDREELKNAPLGWLVREVQAAEEGLEAGALRDRSLAPDCDALHFKVATEEQRP